MPQRAALLSILSGYFNNQVQFLPSLASIFPTRVLQSQATPPTFPGVPLPSTRHRLCTPTWGPTRQNAGSPREHVSPNGLPGPSTTLEHKEASAQSQGKGSGGRNTKGACPLPTAGPPLFGSSHFCPFPSHQKLEKRVMFGEDALG